jgi:hypothetical protein
LLLAADELISFAGAAMTLHFLAASRVDVYSAICWHAEPLSHHCLPCSAAAPLRREGVIPPFRARGCDIEIASFFAPLRRSAHAISDYSQPACRSRREARRPAAHSHSTRANSFSRRAMKR